jgi:phosphoribosylaminoimidazole (AIR) synthetase
MAESISYSDAGVSIDNANRAVAKIRERSMRVASRGES